MGGEGLSAFLEGDRAHRLHWPAVGHTFGPQFRIPRVMFWRAARRRGHLPAGSPHHRSSRASTYPLSRQFSWGGEWIFRKLRGTVVVAIITIPMRHTHGPAAGDGSICAGGGFRLSEARTEVTCACRRFAPEPASPASTMASADSLGLNALGRPSRWTRDRLLWADGGSAAWRHASAKVLENVTTPLQVEAPSERG
jgi:hypothetical protein